MDLAFFTTGFNDHVAWMDSGQIGQFTCQPWFQVRRECSHCNSLCYSNCFSFRCNIKLIFFKWFFIVKAFSGWALIELQWIIQKGARSHPLSEHMLSTWGKDSSWHVSLSSHVEVCRPQVLHTCVRVYQLNCIWSICIYDWLVSNQ